MPFFYVCSPPPSRIPPAYLTTSQLSFQILSLSQAWLRTFLLLEPRHSHSHIYNQDTKSRHFCAHKYLSSLLRSHPLTRPHALTFSDTATRTHILWHSHTHSCTHAHALHGTKNGLACSIPHAITSSVLTHTGDKKERKKRPATFLSVSRLSQKLKILLDASFTSQLLSLKGFNLRALAQLHLFLLFCKKNYPRTMSFCFYTAGSS